MVVSLEKGLKVLRRYVSISMSPIPDVDDCGEYVDELTTKNYLDIKNESDSLLICRPLSDLTKEIEHNGEIFIPIIELAKIAFNNLDLNFDNIKFEIDSSDGAPPCILNGKVSFSFDTSDMSFIVINTNRTVCVPNQLQCFQWLIAHHFNLMDESERFIDVNTLPKNPYA